MARRLFPEESALWRRVAATVAPIAKRVPTADAEAGLAAPPPPAKATKPVKGRVVPPAPPPAPLRPRPSAFARASLDGTWDRRLRKGLVRPDMSIDLHGHSLASAHVLLEESLARAVQRGARVVLVIAGRVRPGPHHATVHGEARPRGAIRAALPDWLAHSAQSDAILATRPAAPVHGGGGAVYVVLRRPLEDR